MLEIENTQFDPNDYISDIQGIKKENNEATTIDIPAPEANTYEPVNNVNVETPYEEENDINKFAPFNDDNKKGPEPLQNQLYLEKDSTYNNDDDPTYPPMGMAKTWATDEEIQEMLDEHRKEMKELEDEANLLPGATPDRLIGDDNMTHPIDPEEPEIEIRPIDPGDQDIDIKPIDPPPVDVPINEASEFSIEEQRKYLEDLKAELLGNTNTMEAEQETVTMSR